jgi:hypothetical protein
MSGPEQALIDKIRASLTLLVDDIVIGSYAHQIIIAIFNDVTILEAELDRQYHIRMQEEEFEG